MEDKVKIKVDHLTKKFGDLLVDVYKRQGQIRCPACYQYNETDSIYCSRCGKKLEKKKNDEQQ